MKEIIHYKIYFVRIGNLSSVHRRFLNQFERSDPPFAFSYDNRRDFLNTTKTYNEHVYAPRLNAFKQGWDSAKMLSRVGRVCKVS